MTTPDNAQLRAVWQNGWCGVYAHALTELRPDLRIGESGTLDDDGYSPGHIYAHDDRYAYDSLGKHPLPYLGIHGQFDHAELNMTSEDVGCLSDQFGNADSPEARTAVEEAKAHAISMGVLDGT